MYDCKLKPYLETWMSYRTEGYTAYVYIYIYIYIYGEMVDLVESDKMIELVEKGINQTLTMGLVVIFRSLFTEELLQMWIKNKILPLNPL